MIIYPIFSQNKNITRFYKIHSVMTKEIQNIEKKESKILKFLQITIVLYAFSYFKKLKG